jgi:hypothetical protein
MQKKSLNKLKIVCLSALVTSTSLWACNGSHVSGIGNVATAYTVSANTMEEGGYFVGLNTEYLRNDKLSDATMLEALQNGKEHMHHIDSLTSYSISLSYGITDNLTLNMQLPYVYRSNIRAGEDDGAGPEIHSHGDTEGVGDASALLQYKIYDKEVKIALLAGVKAPTGKDNLKDGDETLEADLQPGSGSWDIFAGAALTKDFEDFSIHADMLYKYNNTGVGQSQLGDLFTYNIALSYKLLDHQHNELLEKNHGFGYSLSTFIEFNGEMAKKDEYAGHKSDNTGHDVIFATTGLQLIADDSYSLLFSISTPIYQNFNGIQNEVNYRTSFSLGKSF